MTALSRLINLTAAFQSTRSGAQAGLFFDDMADMVARLAACGHNVTQVYDDRALVDNSVWLTVSGVAYPA